MTVSNTTLYEMVGRELGLTSGAETLSTDDANVIGAAHTSVRAWLIEDGTAYWTDGSIPDAVSLPLAKIVAGQVKASFGRDDYQDGPVGYELLRQNVSKRSARQPVTSEYF